MRYALVLLILLSLFVAHAQEIALQAGEAMTVSIQAESSTILRYEGVANNYISLSAQAITTEDSSPDLVIWVLDPESQLIVYEDNSADSTNPSIENLYLAQDGVYSIYVDSFNGVTEGEVEILLEETSPFNVSIEEGENFQRVSVNLPPSQVFRHVFESSEGQNLEITVKDLSGGLDPYLRLFDAEGNLLAENDDHNSLNLNLDLFDSQLSITIPETGAYQLEVRDFLGRAGQIEVLIERLSS